MVTRPPGRIIEEEYLPTPTADKHTARPPDHDAVIKSLSDSTGVDPMHVQALYEREFATLEKTATVRSFLSVIASRNVREVLRHS